MNDIQTVSEAFVAYLENEGVGVFGVDLFLNQVPENAPDDCWWVITGGGQPTQKLATGGRVKQYIVSVYHRAIKNKNVERELFELEETLNCASCVSLEGFDVIEISANQFPSDDDLDGEERRIGFLQVTVSLYKTC